MGQKPKFYQFSSKPSLIFTGFVILPLTLCCVECVRWDLFSFDEQTNREALHFKKGKMCDIISKMGGCGGRPIHTSDDLVCTLVQDDEVPRMQGWCQ